MESCSVQFTFKHDGSCISVRWEMAGVSHLCDPHVSVNLVLFFQMKNRQILEDRKENVLNSKTGKDEKIHWRCFRNNKEDQSRRGEERGGGLEA